MAAATVTWRADAIQGCCSTVCCFESKLLCFSVLWSSELLFDPWRALQWADLTCPHAAETQHAPSRGIMLTQSLEKDPLGSQARTRSRNAPKDETKTKIQTQIIWKITRRSLGFGDKFRAARTNMRWLVGFHRLKENRLWCFPLRLSIPTRIDPYNMFSFERFLSMDLNKK